LLVRYQDDVREWGEMSVYLLNKNKDLLVRYHDNVREWGEMSVYLLKQEQRLVGSLSG
jgi:hypothetical protein